jgi:polyphosphate kinase 2 (PPK2 family)
MSKVRLKDVDTRAPKEWDKKETREKMSAMLEELDKLQNLLYAERKHSLLVIIQGMDASGKDGVIRNVFTSMNPVG